VHPERVSAGQRLRSLYRAAAAGIVMLLPAAAPAQSRDVPQGERGTASIVRIEQGGRIDGCAALFESRAGVMRIAWNHDDVVSISTPAVRAAGQVMLRFDTPEGMASLDTTTSGGRVSATIGSPTIEMVKRLQDRVVLIVGEQRLEYSLGHVAMRDILSDVEHCARHASALPVSGPPAGPVTDGVDWVPQMAGQFPAHAAVTGRDTNGQPLYTCSAERDGALHPGKIRQGFDGCVFGYGGREYTARSYRVMVGVPRWAWASHGQVPPNALQSGNEADERPLFACRTEYRGSMQLGKIRPGFNGCNFSYGGREMTGAFYEVLMG